MKTKPIFEHTECNRCLGSGFYSIGTCFGCNGSGFKLTKRGRATQNYFNDMRMRLAEEFKAGDLILFQGFNAGSYSEKSKFYRVEKVEQLLARDAGYISNPDTLCVKITCDGISFIGFAGSSKYRAGFTNEEKQAQIADALAYQAKLTKMGKVSKKAV
jgi:hypothetical protein